MTSVVKTICSNRPRLAEPVLVDPPIVAVADSLTETSAGIVPNIKPAMVPRSAANANTLRSTPTALTLGIGGAIAGHAGVDFLCYVTPSEHLCLPNVDDVRRGVIASRIAAHSADLANGLPSAVKKDNDMSRARNELDWDEMFKIALDPVEAKRYRSSRKPTEDEVCSMCGEVCAIRLVNRALK